MNYFEVEKFNAEDYVALRDLYHKSLVKIVEQQRYIDDLEKTCHLYKTVDKAHRHYFTVVK